MQVASAGRCTLSLIRPHLVNHVCPIRSNRISGGRCENVAISSLMRPAPLAIHANGSDGLSSGSSRRSVILGLHRRLGHVSRQFLACGEPDDILMRLAILDHLFEGMRHMGSATKLGVNERGCRG